MRLLVLALLAAQYALAVPIEDPADSLDLELDFQPVSLIDHWNRIVSPAGGEVWHAGGRGRVEWDPVLPAGLNRSVVPITADLLLGYLDDTSISLHLDIDHPLATDIPLYDGPPVYEFTIPRDLPTKDSYILALLGSSGNRSPPFTIIRASNSTSRNSSSVSAPAFVSASASSVPSSRAEVASITFTPVAAVSTAAAAQSVTSVSAVSTSEASRIVESLFGVTAVFAASFVLVG